jgi:hypothetical protein
VLRGNKLSFSCLMCYMLAKISVFFKYKPTYACFCKFYILLTLFLQFLAISGRIRLKMESDVCDSEVRDPDVRDTLIDLK